MKFHLIPGVLAFGLATLIPAAAQNEAPADKTTDPTPVPPAAPVDPAKVKTQSSYGLGFRAGGEFAQQYGQFGITPADLETESFLKGFLAAFKGDKPEVSEEELKGAMQALGEVLQAREKEGANKNLEAGKKFLEENGKREGVTTTKSGLQYEVLKKGGEEKYVAPKEGAPEKQFMVHYKGTLIDGTEFDASPEGEPVPMGMQVIEGFKEALTTMPVGSKWKLFIPSGMAYGEQRRSAEIAPNSVLIFDLELVKIQDAPKADPHGGLPFPMPEEGQGE
ncbi:FKBP-type peptidyl-prolyl cis-trans isomerase [Luteolibacter arcticus]|uniref:Peptidyl-prolyl cis-trans isomerase n=1 Tax=Luteolibacter arcticus TaxID=1581411 RepID=A0ABT3GGI8_9BACT|nr:FKBP-type peptidyl-prolyl cis-trans isomerase [Luteolibacter arcticus]MCW1922726.1 FKBP-type peptidyl-prolyl cis-trans isomerase [Luteolibacter arcticus]